MPRTIIIACWVLFLCAGRDLAAEDSLAETDLPTTASVLAEFEQMKRESTVENLRMSMKSMKEAERGLLASEDRDGWRKSGVLSALREGRDADLVVELGSVLERYPANLATYGGYGRMVDSCRRLGDTTSADMWARRGAAACEELFQRYGDNPAMLCSLHYYRYLSSRICDYSEADYAHEKQLYRELAAKAEYSEYADFPLTALSALEYDMGNYDEVLRLCDEVDAFHERVQIPHKERSRRMHDKWRAKALYRLGKKQEGINLLERLRSDPSWAFQRDALSGEIEMMSKDMVDESFLQTRAERFRPLSD